MNDFLQKIGSFFFDLPVVVRIQADFKEQPWANITSLAVIWLCSYAIIHFLSGARGSRAIKLIATPLVLGALFFMLMDGNETHNKDLLAQLSLLYTHFLVLAGLVLLVAFQPELRRSIVHFGEMRFIHLGRGQRQRVIDEVSSAVEYLAKNRIGALVAIERQISMAPYLESGTTLDALVSKELLATVFWPGCMLHDLGLVIRGDRAASAGVQFPLADADLLPRELGSRHRAALGLSLEVDAMIIVVSEETGTVSFAYKGRLKRHVTAPALRELLDRGLPRTTWFGFRRKKAEEPLVATDDNNAPASPRETR